MLFDEEMENPSIPSFQMPESDGGSDASFKEDDIIIVLIGQTGTGKSSFANHVIGAEKSEVGHSLKSCTSAIRILRHSSPPKPDFVLIDTPGFNDTHLSDIQVLETITQWLSSTYRRSVMLSGVLYFHRITDNRLTGTERQNIGIFESLVGKVALENVVIVSTMWDEILEEEAEKKEKALKADAWKFMMSKGAQVARHNNTRESALDIVGMLQGGNRYRALLVQQEMVNHGKALPETTVGQKVASFWGYLRKVTDEVIFGLERKVKEGWTEEIGQEIARNKGVVKEIDELEERWSLSLNPLRKWFGLGAAQQPNRLGPQSSGLSRSSTLRSGFSRTTAPSVMSHQTSTSSVYSPSTPVYDIPLQTLPTHATTCLKEALLYKPSVPVEKLRQLVEDSHVIVKRLQEIWPEETTFARPIMHMVWFVLAVINHVGVEDSSGDQVPHHSHPPESTRKSTDVVVDDSHRQIVSLTISLAEYLHPVRSMLSDVNVVSARRREQKKKRIIDKLAYQTRMTILCSNLAEYTSRDPLRLSIFTADPSVKAAHHLITQNVAHPIADNSWLSEQALHDTIIKEFGGLRRLMEHMTTPRSQPPPEQCSKMIINGGNFETNVHDITVNLPRRKNTWGKAFAPNSKRKNSLLSIASTSTSESSGSCPPSCS